MKKLYLVTLVALSAMFMSSCKTLSWAKDNITPEMLGRDVTVAYLLTKKKLDEDHVEAVKKTYEVFNTVITSTEAGDTAAIKALIVKGLDDALKDKPEVRALARLALDLYWTRLEEKFKVESLSANETYQILKRFHTGIETALRDYKFLR